MAAIIKRRLLSLARAAGLYQPLDADLTAIAALTRTRGDLIRGGASGWEDFAAAAANTFVGGDGTDVTTRTAAQVLTSLSIVTGTYTPTLTNTTNLSASTAYVCNYIRVGSNVIVFGKFDADAVSAASTATNLGISLPVASSVSNESQAGGTAANNGNAMICRITADAGSGRARALWNSATTANAAFAFIFGYEII